MNYFDRLPLIGGFIELTKSKKGVAIILAVVIYLGGTAYGVETEVLALVGATILTYLGGQSYVDSKKETGTIFERVDDVMDAIDGTETSPQS